MKRMTAKASLQRLIDAQIFTSKRCFILVKYQIKGAYLFMTHQAILSLLELHWPVGSTWQKELRTRRHHQLMQSCSNAVKIKYFSEEEKFEQDFFCWKQITKSFMTLQM